MSMPNEKDPQQQRQTISFLTRRFREVGLQPASRHGQNFLIDLNLQLLLFDTAELTGKDVVLEVGTGTGALTARIAAQAAAVITVEIDRHLFQLASEELIDCPNVTMLQRDVLRNKNRLASEVLESVWQQLNDDAQYKLVANLPYNIASVDDGHDPKRIGRSNPGAAFDQRLWALERLDTKPVSCGMRADHATHRLLAQTQDKFGDRPSRARSGTSQPDPRSYFFSPLYPSSFFSSS